MSDASTLPESLVQGVLGPESHHVSQFNIGANPSEVLLNIGRGRQLIAPNGEIGVHLVNEWIFSAAMSPQTAKDLAKSLARIIADYEERFGTIIEIPGVR